MARWSNHPDEPYALDEAQDVLIEAVQVWKANARRLQALGKAAELRARHEWLRSFVGWLAEREQLEATDE